MKDEKKTGVKNNHKRKVYKNKMKPCEIILQQELRKKLKISKIVV